MTLPLPLTLGYWFRLYPLPLAPVMAKVLLCLMLALVCAGVAVLLYSRLGKDLLKPLRAAWRSLGTVLLWAGIVGLFLYAMTAQSVPVLGMRLWYVVWFGLFAWLTFRAVRRFLKDLPLYQKQEAARSSYEKWLPKPKK